MYFLIAALMPEIDIEWLKNQWDINWNDAMEEWLVAGIPLRNYLANRLLDVPFDVSDIRAWI